MKKYNVAILGATGAVGQEFLNLIEERNFPFAELKLLASKRSAGKKIQFMGKEYTVEEATDASFEGVDIALFAGGAASKTFAPAAVKAGAVVIDNSSAFRMDPEVPLVVPEVNPEAIASHKGIIANPNCSTIIMVMALKPLYDVSKIKRIVVSTYQAVSGGGKEAMAELEEQVKAINEGREVVANILPGASLAKHYQIAFNLIPQIDVFKENLYTKEEMKMIDETKKIMSDDSLRITATTVRVPVYRSHAESVNVEFEDEISVEKAREVLAAFPGVTLTDNPDEQVYPMPLETSGKDDVEVGRIRKDYSIDNGLNFWVCGDQIRKGAALNALQIAEYMIEHDMF
ncbi:aspartate-semialdehyde dehydrogenase [Anaerovibrio slackiae]|uniref:Aspartate-semialdehyde dehydrogenase n=1 Tax=Anaerovibrio slackiae TaxID=2652309 RepID=A0A6I2UDM4_9FIRM|nr:aspartate-semialdehyde dehydrogenase [Anaerovibrio slackiae]MBQ5585146.1 aspartate-semialdehyde dehydrogenase [Selenomonadaceae bacterium]MBQ5651120.1 aspartate-semialdehyde dehydrogenase [Selenomonadaceae bacterium]MBQ5733748.1 aspartate-semialdehyde dehydrogenase [Selenomonadaceae bacterium]MBQ5919851.1 aspartate-semialdehyde dehydrogenase [Selenomonadaceae bacterium]MCI6484547.1 aspartate-semialdehyde dehydrogenase [Selenomonadaceae bacterium]